MKRNKISRLKAFKNELRTIIKRLETGYKPERIILFGSLAEGKITTSSDIDLLIIKKTNKDHWSRLQDADQYLDHNYPVDFLVYTPEEIKQRLKIGDIFVEDIVKKGKVIYEK
jgi:predicted nucleotidyltransferase